MVIVAHLHAYSDSQSISSTVSNASPTFSMTMVAPWQLRLAPQWMFFIFMVLVASTSMWMVAALHANSPPQSKSNSLATLRMFIVVIAQALSAQCTASTFT
eukprot:76759_1